MSDLKQKAEKILQAILYPRAKPVIKGKVVAIGSDGCARHLDIDL
jgi:hypothetical protein